MVYNFFDKQSRGSGVATANELHRQIIRNLKKEEAYSSFRDTIWGVDLVDV